MKGYLWSNRWVVITNVDFTISFPYIRRGLLAAVDVAMRCGGHLDSWWSASNAERCAWGSCPSNEPVNKDSTRASTTFTETFYILDKI
jgi:hypothetical protein